MSDRDVIRSLLEIELSNFAVKLNFIEGQVRSIPDGLCLESLNLLSNISNREESDFNRQLAIMIVALVWTHSKLEIRDSLRQIFTPILSTLGFSPSNLMIDEGLKNDGIYSSIGSYLDKLRIAANDARHQVIVNGREYTLTRFQADLWSAFEKSELLGVSAPTSAGKSFLLYLKIVDLVAKGKTRFVYVVPTLSLISQVTSDLSKLLKDHELGGIDILNTYEHKLESFVYVVTQERAISLFAEDGVREIDLLVVDEIQNIEKVSSEGEDRSKILYDVLIDIRNDIEVGQILLSGPRLKNIGSLGFEIFGQDSVERKTDSPPVFSLTYSVSKKGKSHFLNQYSTFFTNPLQMRIKNDKYIQGLGGVQYTEKFNNYLHEILRCLTGDVNVVFSPTSIQARKSAKSFSLTAAGSSSEKLQILSKYLKDSVHPKYELAEIVEAGVAYHTGKTPLHVRKTIEAATSEKVVRTLFCTTTLMQGVNLPAKNVVVRNPNLFTQRRAHSAELSAYEFANLRGRAGRLLTDFIGRTVVLDESSFSGQDGSTDSLFPEDYKEISTGYRGTFEEYSEEISSTLSDETLIDDSPAKGLVTYIRQTLFRHGEKGQSRLRNVGLEIEDSLLQEVALGLERLKVPREVVLANRYWDPFDLDILYGIFKEKKKELPVNVFQSGLYQELLDWMNELKNSMPFYFNKYLVNVSHEGYMYGIAKSAESWAREIPLSQILIERFPPSSTTDLDNKIDGEIDKLGKHVSYGLPMLLKPISDMGKKESSIISSIELGIYAPLTKYLSDRGVPRETAIKITGTESDTRSSDTVKSFSLESARKELNYWELKQVEHLL